jgi:uncharacterized protein (TIGR02246 family)
MRSYLRQVILFVGFTAAMSMAAEPSMASLQEVRNAIASGNRAFAAALKKGDSAAIAAMYASGAKVMPSNSDVISGKDAIRRFWQGAIDSGIKSATLTAVDVEARSDLAVETGKYVMLGADGKKVDSGKYIVVWKRESGKWKLFRDIWNTSMPAAPAQ